MKKEDALCPLLLGNVQTMLCVSFGSEEATYSGSLSGGVYKWKDRTLVQVIDGYHKVGSSCQSTHRGPILHSCHCVIVGVACGVGGGLGVA